MLTFECLVQKNIKFLEIILLAFDLKKIEVYISVFVKIIHLDLLPIFMILMMNLKDSTLMTHSKTMNTRLLNGKVIIMRNFFDNFTVKTQN